MKFEDLPIKVQEDSIALSKQINGYKNEFSDFVEFVRVDVDYIELKDAIREYYFIVSDPLTDNNNVNKTTFKISYLPTHDLHYEALVTRVGIEGVQIHFNRWTSLLKRLNEIQKKKEELQQQANEGDIYIPYEEVENNDDLISTEDQQKLNAGLLQLQNSLEENRSKYPVTDIIKEIETIRQNLATLPERVIKQMGQHVIKKIVDLGQEAVKDIIIDSTKDLIKYLFFGEGVRQLLTHLHLIT